MRLFRVDDFTVLNLDEMLFLHKNGDKPMIQLKNGDMVHVRNINYDELELELFKIFGGIGYEK